MAGCLLDAGVDLTVHDIRREAAEPLVQRGAIWADSAEAAVSGCEIAWTSLPGPIQVESVLLGNEAGVLSAMPPGTVFVDTTTNDPDVARRVSTACSERGLVMLDAPVSGRPPTMTMMIGGEREVFERVRDTLDSVAAQVFYVGPAGAGCVAQAGNAIHGLHQPDRRH